MPELESNYFLMHGDHLKDLDGADTIEEAIALASLRLSEDQFAQFYYVIHPVRVVRHGPVPILVEEIAYAFDSE